MIYWIDKPNTFINMITLIKKCSIFKVMAVMLLERKVFSKKTGTCIHILPGLQTWTRIGSDFKQRWKLCLLECNKRISPMCAFYCTLYHTVHVHKVMTLHHIWHDTGLYMSLHCTIYDMRLCCTLHCATNSF